METLQLKNIIEQEIKAQDANLSFYPNDEIYNKVLKKYRNFLDILKTNDILTIFEFLKSLIEDLLKIINECNSTINSTVDVVREKEDQDIYELNEYFNIVFYIYNLFLNKNFNRSDSLKYSFSKHNLETILNICKQKLN